MFKNRYPLMVIAISGLAGCAATAEPMVVRDPAEPSGATLACLTAEVESNDGQSRANPGVCSAQPVTGSIRNSRDVDWYRFDVAAGSAISISLTHGNGKDFDWYLYRGTGSSVARGTTSRIPEVGSYTASAAETYYFEVVRYSGTGSYAFELTFDGDDGGGGGGGGGGDCGFGARPSLPSGLSAFLLGDGADTCVTPAGAGLLLMGGGSDVDAAFSNRIRAPLGGGDIVVLRTTGTDAYNSYFRDLMAADTVETIIVDSVAKANSAYVEWAVRSAEFVWFAGGDQSTYVANWQGTKLQQAAKDVYARGGMLGGTSAGLAVLGDVIYDPNNVAAATSATAVVDPCGTTMKFSEHFFDFPSTQGLITDTHFAPRDRMGRLLAFMARIGAAAIQPTRQPITGVGVDEATSMFLDAAGTGVIDGAGSAYVLREDASTVRTTVRCGSPIEYGGVLRYRLRAGDTFSFPTSASSVSPIRIGIDGRQSAFYTPANPY